MNTHFLDLPMHQDAQWWLLTSTTYGTWLPGDERGFVGRVLEQRQGDKQTHPQEHDQPGTPYDQHIPKLKAASAHLMKAEPVWLTPDQAQVVLAQFQETAAYRGWSLAAASVMANHFHLVVAADADVLTDRLLRDFKSYASRVLNRHWPRDERWWTTSGSRRSLPNQQAQHHAIRYTIRQNACLARWLNPDYGTLESILAQ